VAIFKPFPGPTISTMIAAFEVTLGFSLEALGAEPPSLMPVSHRKFPSCIP
jgi:hypothetical protein